MLLRTTGPLVCPAALCGLSLNTAARQRTPCRPSTLSSPPLDPSRFTRTPTLRYNDAPHTRAPHSPPQFLQLTFRFVEREKKVLFSSSCSLISHAFPPQKIHFPPPKGLGGAQGRLGGRYHCAPVVPRLPPPRRPRRRILRHANRRRRDRLLRPGGRLRNRPERPQSAGAAALGRLLLGRSAGRDPHQAVPRAAEGGRGRGAVQQVSVRFWG